jgi:hypothetical protein
MGKFVLLQAFYCITGILFFVHDLFSHVDMAKAMVNAFIWPYAQWPLMRDHALQMYQSVGHLAH